MSALTNPKSSRASLPSLVMLALSLGGIASAAENDAERFWPQWRGPGADGVAPESSPPLEWAEGKNVVWKVELPGAGNGSPIVWGDRVYLLTAVPTGEAAAPHRLPDPEGRDPHPSVSPATEVMAFTVLALDRGSGETVWRTVVREEVPHDGTHQDGSYASSSPVTDGERVYAFFGSRGTYALDLYGQIVWQKDLGDMTVRRGFGEGASPALYEDKLVLLWDHEGPSFIVTLDKVTGEELWRQERDEITSWTTPLVVSVGGKAQVVTAATQKVRSYDLETGELLWESPGMTLNSIPSPVDGDGLVYLMSGFRGSTLQAIPLATARGELTAENGIAWTHERDTPYVPSPLLYDGILYFMKSNSGILSALDAKSGESYYLERVSGIDNVYASPVAADGRVYITSRDGVTVVLKHGKTLEILSTNELDDGFDASPAVAGDEIFLRGHRSLYKIAEGPGDS